MALRAAGVLLLASFAGGCGRVVPHGGEPRSPETASNTMQNRSPRRFDPIELLPGDLNLVLRLDVASIRRSLGPTQTEELLRRGMMETSIQPALESALKAAEILWLGTRIQDWQEGDRVLVAEFSKHERTPPPPEAWSPRPSGVAALRRYVANDAVLRSGIAELLDFAHARAFVSPVEAASVRRVLGRGPDPNRRDPEARGLVSLDLRPPRPSAELLRRHPAIGSLLDGIERVEAVLEVTSDELIVSARIRCQTERTAERVATFLSAFNNAAGARTRLAGMLGAWSAKAADRSVTVRWPISADVLADLTRDTNMTKPAPTMPGVRMPAPTIPAPMMPAPALNFRQAP